MGPLRFSNGELNVTFIDQCEVGEDWTIGLSALFYKVQYQEILILYLT